MKSYRLNRLFNAKSGRCFDVAVDHGFFNERGFLQGIEDLGESVKVLVAANPDAIQLTVGQARHLQSIPGKHKPDGMATRSEELQGKVAKRTLLPGRYIPVTAIREADTDGNPATTADPNWLPLFDPSTPVAPGAPALVTPPFPDNPSGHNCGAGAVVTALQQFFGRDRVPLTLTSNQSGTTRSFARLSDILDEVINARVWAGIHFRTAYEEGAKLGETVARYEHRHYFQPIHG